MAEELATWRDVGKKVAAGALAGIVGTTAIYPVDVVKTRLQNTHAPVPLAQLPRYVLDMYRRSGNIFKAFYPGLSANLLGVTPEKAIKLTVNDVVRTKLARRLGVGERDLPWQYGMVAGACAGTAQCVATTPMEMAKIQMQMHSTTKPGSTNKDGSTTKPGSGSTNKDGVSLAHVYRTVGGWRGLYRGFGATLARDIPFSLLLFPSHALLKRHTDGKYPLLTGCVAGCVGALAATPMDVVKTRLQTSSPTATSGLKSMGTVYREIWREEGAAAFFKGSLQRCMIVAPLFGISLCIFDLLK